MAGGINLSNINDAYRYSQTGSFNQVQPRTPTQYGAPSVAPGSTYYQPTYRQAGQSYRAQQAPASSPYQSPWDEKIVSSINDRLGQMLSQDPNRISRTDADVMPMIQAQDALAQREARRARQAAAERAGAEGTLEGGNFAAQVGQINDLYHQRQAAAEAQLMNQQLGQRRAQIMQALQLGSGLIDADTERGLRKELADMQNQQFYQDLGLRADLGFGQLDLGWAQNALQGELGRGDLSLRGRQLDQQNSQFYDRLGFDQASFEAQMNNAIAQGLMGF